MRSLVRYSLSQYQQADGWFATFLQEPAGCLQEDRRELRESVSVGGGESSHSMTAELAANDTRC